MLNKDPGVCALILYNQSKRNPFGFYCWRKKKNQIFHLRTKSDNYIPMMKMKNWDPGLHIFILTNAFRCVCRALKIDVRLIVELRTFPIRTTCY